MASVTPFHGCISSRSSLLLARGCLSSPFSLSILSPGRQSNTRRRPQFAVHNTPSNLTALPSIRLPPTPSDSISLRPLIIGVAIAQQRQPSPNIHLSRTPPLTMPALADTELYGVLGDTEETYRQLREQRNSALLSRYPSFHASPLPNTSTPGASSSSAPKSPRPSQETGFHVKRAHKPRSDEGHRSDPDPQEDHYQVRPPVRIRTFIPPPFSRKERTLTSAPLLHRSLKTLRIGAGMTRKPKCGNRKTPLAN